MDKILIVADPKDSCCATPRGLELAQKLGFAAEVVAFTYTSLRSISGGASAKASVRKQLLKEREAAVRKRIAAHRSGDQKVSLKVVWEKHPEQWIDKRCKSAALRGVVKTCSSNEDVARSPVDWQLLSQCPVPTLMVAAKKWHRTKPILVALNLSTTSKAKLALNAKLLGTARDLAASLGVPLHIVSAINIPTLLSDLDLVDPLAYVKEAKEGMQPYIRKLAAEYDIPQKSFYAKKGPVEKVITSYAAKVRAQVVVMGVANQGKVPAYFLGNTAARVLEHLHTDVLVIKP